MNLGTKPSTTLRCLAKYYFAQGYKKAKVRALIETYIKQVIPATNILNWQSIIDRQVSFAQKHALIEIDAIPITQAELDICRSLNGVRAQRLLFTLICIAKYYDLACATNNHWVNQEDRDIFALANVAVPIKEQSLMLNDLRNLGYIKFSRRTSNTNVNVTCIDESGGPVMFVSDFRNLGFQYMKMFGGPYLACACCGLVVHRFNNRQKYCPTCAVEMNRRNTADRTAI